MTNLRLAAHRNQQLHITVWTALSAYLDIPFKTDKIMKRNIKSYYYVKQLWQVNKILKTSGRKTRVEKPINCSMPPTEVSGPGTYRRCVCLKIATPSGTKGWFLWSGNYFWVLDFSIGAKVRPESLQSAQKTAVKHFIENPRFFVLLRTWVLVCRPYILFMNTKIISLSDESTHVSK